MQKTIKGLMLALFVLAIATPGEAQFALKQSPPILVGEQNHAQLAESGRFGWLSDGAGRYTPSPEVVNELKHTWAPGLQVVAFSGSWCPDTHRELPRFYKVCHEAGIPEEEINLFFLDRQFNSGTGLEQKYRIKSVPVFVVLRSGKEIGRITEKANQPMEEELLRIIKR